MSIETGRELDAIVAEKVMGFVVARERRPVSWKHGADIMSDMDGTKRPEEVSIWQDILILCDADGTKRECIYLPGGRDWQQVPDYSTNIAAAWEVVGKLRKDGYGIIFNDTRVQYRCRFWRHDGKDAWNIFTWVGEPDTEYTIWADTAPLAICLAALKAVGHAD